MSKALLKDFAASLCEREKGIEVLDWMFPIREGQSRVDLVARSPAREIIFIWKQDRCNAAAIGNLLADYDWIEKNGALWPHLFTQIKSPGPLKMMFWIFAGEIDPEVRFFLPHIKGIQLRLFRYFQNHSSTPWTLTPWPEPPVLSEDEAPRKLKVVSQTSEPLLSKEEIDDLIRIPPALEAATDETTESHFG